MNQELQFHYDQITKYDTHYSTARTAAVTLLFTVSVLVSVNLVIKPDVVASLFGLITIVIVLAFAVLLSTHFQQLTDACAMAHDDLAEWGNTASKPLPSPRRIIQNHCEGIEGFKLARKRYLEGFNAYVTWGAAIFLIINCILFLIVQFRACSSA
ncbi:MAG: hypothetical protein U1E66_06350 [Rhodospirillales bacterium]